MTTPRTMIGGLLALATVTTAAAGQDPQFERDIAPVLKRHCVKCHGPAKQEAKLNLSAITPMVQGGTSGPVIVPHDLEGSLIWKRISTDEMPPEKPLTAKEKLLLKRWILAGTPGLKRDNSGSGEDHWAFRPLSNKPAASEVAVVSSSPLDALIAQHQKLDNITMSPEADRATLIRRVSFDLTGLPPETDAIRKFQDDPSPDAFERMVDRYLASPHYGERLGKVWLDAAGYADSNGYFGADTDRPLAYRYRDYVIRALNSDMPYDQFIREQMAGDEIATIAARNGETVDFKQGNTQELKPSRVIELLEATHYLRCGQDGSGESDGNPDEVRVDRYTVLETAMQNVSTGLLGLTIQCAKCHDHKFEPLTQRDYYAFQAVLIPAFPPEQWVKPNDRFVYASLPGELETWQNNVAQSESDLAKLRDDLSLWVRTHRPQGNVLFADSFDGQPESIEANWSNTAPGDDAPGGTAAVHLNSRDAPAAVISSGHLEVIEGGPGGDKWISTRQSFDWTPDVGASIQVTFDLIANHVGSSRHAERIGYFIALHDFNDNSSQSGGNLLIDGHPMGSTAVYVDYPGTDSRQVGEIGNTGYVPGRNYGLRITNKGDGKYLLEQLVDWQVEKKSITLSEADLPNGGFGFEFCCERSFVVDNVVVESFAPSGQQDLLKQFLDQLKEKRQPLEAAQKRKDALATSRPGKIAWTTDVTDPPEVHVLLRGNYKTPGEPVQPAGYTVLEQSRREATSAKNPLPRGSGRRLAFANWLTQPETPRSALLARVHVNRLWQHHFGIGIVGTPDNFGVSGSPPSFPDAIENLAYHFTRHDLSSKSVSRAILQSAVYRQSSRVDAERLLSDPDARRLSRFPIRRLDAEAIRDSLLAAAGDLDDQLYGRYVPTSRTGTGEVVVPENHDAARRRSIYLQQKRTQIHSLLQVFDAPSIVFNSTRRPTSTMPLQSLNLLNSDFAAVRAKSLATLLLQNFTSDSDRIQNLFERVVGSPPDDDQAAAASRFLALQIMEYPADAQAKAWADLCQAVLISNATLYLE